MSGRLFSLCESRPGYGTNLGKVRGDRGMKFENAWISSFECEEVISTYVEEIEELETIGLASDKTIALPPCRRCRKEAHLRF